MVSVVVPIKSIERMSPLVAAAATVARSIPAPVDIVLDPEFSNSVTTIQPIIDQATRGLAVKIHLESDDLRCLPSGAGRSKSGRAVLVADRESFGWETDKLHTPNRVGPTLLVPGDLKESSQPTLGHILIALVDTDRESIRVAMPITTRIALHCGAQVAIAIVLPEDHDNTSRLGTSERDAERLRFLETMSVQHYLDKLATNLRSRRVRVSWETRTGSPVDEFIRLVETTSPDLVVMSRATRPIAEQLAARTGRMVMLV